MQKEPREIIDGYVYVVDYGDGKTFKIGYTRNAPDLRIKQFVSNVIFPTSKMQIVMTGHTECYARLEKLMHDRFAFANEKGEWFNLDFVQLIEAYQCLAAFSEVRLYDRWHELVPEGSIDDFIEHGVVSPLLPPS